jgi:hypothetical protein
MTPIKPLANGVAARPAGPAVSPPDVMRASVGPIGMPAGTGKKYRPAAPSDGVSRYPFYPKRELPAR